MKPTLQKALKYIWQLIGQYPRVFVLMVIVLLAGNIFEEMVDDVFYDPLEGDHESKVFDELIFNYIRSFESTQLTEVMRDLTGVGSVSVIALLGSVTALVMLIYRKFKHLVYLVIVCGGAPMLIVLMKTYFQRDRPPSVGWLVGYESGLSFPSGHALGATATYLAVAYLLSAPLKRWTYELIIHSAFAIIVALVGISRIYLGVHYATDVIAGIAIGVIWVSIVTIAFELYNRTNKY